MEKVRQRAQEKWSERSHKDQTQKSKQLIRLNKWKRTGEGVGAMEPIPKPHVNYPHGEETQHGTMVTKSLKCKKGLEQIRVEIVLIVKAKVTVTFSGIS